MNPFVAFAKIVVGAIYAVSSFVFPQPKVVVVQQQIQQDQKFGTAIPCPVAFYQDSLALPIGSTDNSFTLTSGNDAQGNPLNSTNCSGAVYGFVIDEGTSIQEVVTGVASGTSVTAVTRGIDVRLGTATSSLAYAHRRGASVKITTSPWILVTNQILNGSGTFPNIISYDGSRVTSSSFTSSTQIVDKAYADNLTFTGAPNGSLGQKGIYQEATKAQTATGTQSGSTGADLIVPNAYFNASSTATTTVVVTDTNGKIDPNFINGTGTYNFAGSITVASATFTGTSTFNSIPLGITQYFGNGRDGSTTIALNTTTTLTRDMYYSNLTVNGALVTGGWRIFVSGNLSGSGVIETPAPTNGNNAVTTSGGAGTTANINGYFHNLGGQGGAPGITTTGSGNNGSLPTSTYTTSLDNNSCSSGGGGTGGGGSNAGGARSGTTATGTINPFGMSAFDTISILDPSSTSATTGITNYVIEGGQPGSGGGSGGSNGSGENSGGGGGGAASTVPVFISANNWGGTFTIWDVGANGGNGAAASGSNNAGGGGAGCPSSGGASIVVYKTKSWTGTYNLAAGVTGSAGAGTGNGASGATSTIAATGTSYEFQINSFTLP